MPDGAPIDFTRKDAFHWISLLRLPEFATREVFQWAVQEAERNKKRDLSAVTFFSYAEGLCVQCLHQGPYDSEPETSRPWWTMPTPRGTVWTKTAPASP